MITFNKTKFTIIVSLSQGEVESYYHKWHGPSIEDGQKQIFGHYLMKSNLLELAWSIYYCNFG